MEREERGGEDPGVKLVWVWVEEGRGLRREDMLVVEGFRLVGIFVVVDVSLVG